MKIRSLLLGSIAVSSLIGCAKAADLGLVNCAIDTNHDFGGDSPMLDLGVNDDGGGSTSMQSDSDAIDDENVGLDPFEDARCDLGLLSPSSAGHSVAG